jgi:Tfp pilus assembly protein PilF
MANTRTTVAAAAASFLLGAGLAAGVMSQSRPAKLKAPTAEPAAVKELAEKVKDLEMQAAEKELHEALRKDPRDKEAVVKFVGRVKNAARAKDGERPFGSL